MLIQVKLISTSLQTVWKISVSQTRGQPPVMGHKIDLRNREIGLDTKLGTFKGTYWISSVLTQVTIHCKPDTDKM